MACIDKTKDMTYLQATEWLEWMSKRFVQQRCRKCLLWHKWKRK